MKIKIDSRGPVIDMEKCVNKMGGRYDLVLIAAQRLREIKRKDRDSQKYSTTVDALIDVQNGIIELSDYILKIK
jgi:DNA-directed RNA polymerase omega subunit